MRGITFIYDFQGIPFIRMKVIPTMAYINSKGFNGEVVTYAGEFFYTFMPVRKRLIDFAEKVYMKIHDMKTKKLIKNRNKEMKTSE